MRFADSRRRQDAPALARLLGDAAMARAALGACGFPIAILDATAPARPVSYVNAAFEALTGYSAVEAMEGGLRLILETTADDPTSSKALGNPGKEFLGKILRDGFHQGTSGDWLWAGSESRRCSETSRS